MQTTRFNRQRRLTLRWLLSGSILGITPFSPLAGTVRAMGYYPFKSEMRRVRGDVRVNGRPAQVGTAIAHGDIVTTGRDAMAVFILGKAVFLVRDDTRIELPGKPEDTLKEKAGQIIRLTRGKLLAVLRRNSTRFKTATAVIGIRGTGLYLEADPEKTYACLCYGKATLGSAVTGRELERVDTRHHESPRYIYQSPRSNGNRIATAPVINHTDAELILLESMVGRKPPFVGNAKGAY